MASERVRNTSRIRFARFQAVDEVEFWDRVDYPEIPAQSDDIEWVVRDVDRMDTLAMGFYGDPILQWVIAVANGYELWPTDLNVGDTIRIPSPRYVRDNLFIRAEF